MIFCFRWNPLVLIHTVQQFLVSFLLFLYYRDLLEKISTRTASKWENNKTVASYNLIVVIDKKIPPIAHNLNNESSNHQWWPYEDKDSNSNARMRQCTVLMDCQRDTWNSTCVSRRQKLHHQHLKHPWKIGHVYGSIRFYWLPFVEPCCSFFFRWRHICD